MKLLVSVVVAATCAVALLGGPAAAHARSQMPTPADLNLDWRAEVAARASFDPLIAKAKPSGSVRAMVRLQARFTVDALSDADRRAEQRREIASAREELVAVLPEGSYRVGHTFDDDVPYFSVELTVPALEALRDSGKAAHVKEVARDRPTLAQSGPLVEATEAAALGFTGAGQTVAVLDTGVDAAHPFLAGKVVAEACINLVTSTCPTGGAIGGSGEVSWGPGAAAPCTYAAQGCQHGTHVAGIVAGSGGTFNGSTFSGIAPGASLLAINVFSPDAGSDCANDPNLEDPCPMSFEDDQIAALKVLYESANTLDLAAVNMSLGGQAYSDSNTCVNANIERALVIGMLLFVQDVPTVVSSGNNGFSNSISAPACIPWAVSVGSVDNSDNVAATSNSDDYLWLLAPGVSVTSSFGGTFSGASGTSMAAPHVAGALAVLSEKAPAASSLKLLVNMQSTGKLVTDPKNAVTTPRLRLLASLVSLGETGFDTAYSEILTGGKVVSEGVGLLGPSTTGTVSAPSSSVGRGTITLSGITGRDEVRQAFLYFMTVGLPDADGVAILDGTQVTGTLVGASRNPGAPQFGNLGVTRVYRADVTQLITGDGDYVVSGVGPTGPQGASLVVILENPPSNVKRHVLVRDGAITALAGEKMTHSFDLQAPLEAGELHVGIGAADVGGEDPMSLGPLAVTGPDAFNGSDGDDWDDHTLPLLRPTALNGLVQLDNSLTNQSDAMAWAYAALAYAV
jgi:subtilisin family serine protease